MLLSLGLGLDPEVPSFAGVVFRATCLVRAILQENVNRLVDWSICSND